jgi:hypothetical protein
VLEASLAAGLTQLTGRSTPRTSACAPSYRKFGFEAAHLTMEKRLKPGPR